MVMKVSRRALIVGGSRGLGAEITLRLVNKGYTVTVLSRTKGELTTVEPLSSGRLSHRYLDFVDPQNVQNFIATNATDLENMDVVVNNLGGNLEERNPLADYSSFQRVMWHNFGYVVEINKKCIEGMIRRKEGKICNVSSVSAIENHGAPQYGAAKAALNVYTKGVGRFLAKHGVTMFGVMPGAIMDNSGYWARIKADNADHFNNFRNSLLPSGSLESATSIANLIFFVLNESDSLPYAGSNILIDGGIARTYS